ncbi:hypothetical protein CDAR_574501 [Caerostris darwini]|uniref:Uncharacterized protein n=1 Tax=Caerostris darwini TaxID=1538125 RepID=A0AAV4UHR6_9ARAC|nr:hypothetical protein CDAR_574501 [Caerostris darwini]
MLLSSLHQHGALPYARNSSSQQIHFGHHQNLISQNHSSPSYYGVGGSNRKWNFYLFLSRSVTQEFGDFIGHLKPRKDRKMNGFGGIVPLIQETGDAKRIFNLENDRSNMCSSLTRKSRFINLLLYFLSGGRELSGLWECGIFCEVYDLGHEIPNVYSFGDVISEDKQAAMFFENANGCFYDKFTLWIISS